MATAEIEGYGSFEIPESFTLKEMRIIERYSGGNLEGFELSKIAGMLHVAIARAKPDVSFEEIQAVVDDIDVEKLDRVFAEDAAGQSPPSQPDSGSRSNEKSESSNGASEPLSDAAPENETPETSGSPDLVGFRSFHSRSGT